MTKLSRLESTVLVAGLAAWLTFIATPTEFRDEHRRIYSIIGTVSLLSICGVGLSQSRKIDYELTHQKPYH